jgi:DNA-binding beta-propeller fold protein YncE
MHRFTERLGAVTGRVAETLAVICMMVAALSLLLSWAGSTPVQAAPLRLGSWDFTLIATILVGGEPRGVALNTASNTIYVASHASNNVSAINGNTLMTFDSIPADFPNGLAYNSADGKLYVGSDPDEWRNNGSIWKINPLTKVREGVQGAYHPRGLLAQSGEVYFANGSGCPDFNCVGRIGYPHMNNQGVTGQDYAFLAADSAGKIYVTAHNGGDSGVARVDGNMVGDWPKVRLTSSQGPAGIAWDSVDQRLYVASMDGGNLAVVKTNPFQIDKVIKPPEVASLALVAIDSNARLLFATQNQTTATCNPLTNGAPEKLYIYDLQSKSWLTNTLTLGQDPDGGIAIDTSRKRLYVSNRCSDTLSVISYSQSSSGPPCEPPAAPSNLVAALASQTQVNLSWADGSSNESGFEVWRWSLDTMAWTKIATVGPNVTSYSDTALTGSVIYLYRIRAYNSCGSSGYSNAAYAIMFSPVSMLTVAEATDPGTVEVAGPGAVSVGQVFTASVVVREAGDPGVFGGQFRLDFEKSYLQGVADSLQPGADLGPDLIIAASDVDNAAGQVSFAVARRGDLSNVTGDVVLGTVSFTVTNPFSSTVISLHDVKVGAKGGVVVPISNTVDLNLVMAAGVDVIGQIELEGRAEDNWGGAEGSVVGTEHKATTGDDGMFYIPGAEEGTFDIKADAAGYLPAICHDAPLVAPITLLLDNPAHLLAGDVNGDDVVNVEDATAIGADFGKSGAGLVTDLNDDGLVDIFDLILMAANFGETTQEWDCQSSAVAQYDLNVRRMDFSTDTPEVGENVQLFIMIASDIYPSGGPYFPESHFQWRKGPGFPWNEVACPANTLYASCVETVEFSYDEAGSYQVEVEADHLNEVVETDETNNTNNWTVTVSPAP